MSTTASDTRIGRLQHQGARVRQEMNGLTAEVESALGDLEKMLRTQLAERPYTTLAAASGLGWVLGGGVPTALTRLVLGFGGRMAFVMMMQQLREGLTAASGGAPAPTAREE
jgi:hypothetical protein